MILNILFRFAAENTFSAMRFSSVHIFTRHLSYIENTFPEPLREKVKIMKISRLTAYDEIDKMAIAPKRLKKISQNP